MPTQKRSIAFPIDMLEALDKLAVKQATDTSKLVRQYVQKGLSVEGYTEDIDFIRNQIREELQAVIRPQIERIVKLLVKTGKISAAKSITLIWLPSKFCVKATSKRQASSVITWISPEIIGGDSPPSAVLPERGSGMHAFGVNADSAFRECCLDGEAHP